MSNSIHRILESELFSKQAKRSLKPPHCNAASPIERTDLWQQDLGHWDTPGPARSTADLLVCSVTGIKFSRCSRCEFLTHEGELHPQH